jgi:ribosomal protein S18 acetylase RimI-like enzyme
MNLVSVNNGNVHLLSNFIENLGPASKTFRYFNKRSVEIISKHLVTLLMLENQTPIAYGHLDPENDVVWLGICVLPPNAGKGIGKEMMNALIAKARENQLDRICLTVDQGNLPAINLYEKFNFQKEDSQLGYYKFALSLRS